MPITGHFEADFSQFNDGVKDATAKLQELEASSVDTGKALDKMGTTAPATMRETTKETSTVTAGMNALGRTAQTVGGMIAGAFTVQQIVAFGFQVMQAADDIEKLATKTGMTAEQVQRLQTIAAETSGSMSAMVSASQTLTAELGASDTSGVAGALRRFNINIEDFKRLDPYERMLALSEGVRAIKDPFAQAAAEEAIFHKNWKDIHPSMIGDMAAIGKGARVMADDVTASVAAMNQKWNQAKTDMQTFAAAALASLSKPQEDFQKQLEQMKGDTDDPTGLKRALAAIPPAQKPVVEGFKGITLSIQEATDASKRETEQATESMKANQARIDAEKAAYDALAAEFKREQDAIDALTERIKGTDLVDAADKWARAMRAAGDNVSVLSSKMRDELGTTMRDAIEAMARNGTLTSAQSSRYAELIVKIDAYNASLKKQTEVVLPAASGAVTEYTQKLYDQARAADAANQAAGGGASGNVGGSTATEGYVVPVNPTTSGSGAGSSYYLPPRRAAGGPVAGGTSYLVGERGPELFTPGASGAISPNGAGVAVYNTFHLVDTESNLARRVSDQIMRSVTQARRI
jgi:hypothetical protein